MLIAELVVNHPTELFDLERQLMKEGKQDSARFVPNIRYKCMYHLEMIDKSKEEEAKRVFEEAEKKMERGGSELKSYF